MADNALQDLKLQLKMMQAMALSPIDQRSTGASD